MKKVWNFLTKTVGTLVIVGTGLLGVILIMDTIRYSKKTNNANTIHSSSIDDLFDEEYDYNFDDDDLD